MQKIQILFPDPLMKKLKQQASTEDRPVSEIVRRATEAWLNKTTDITTVKQYKQVPVFNGGKILISESKLKDAIYE